jgi:sorbitol-6-phosphate 2-dehydrogenase
MKTQAFFAPLVRGTIMSKTGLPWFVCYEKNPAAETVLDVTAEGAAAKNGKAFSEVFDQAWAARGDLENKVPSVVRVTSGGGSYYYLTAPHMAGIKKLKNGGQTGAWDQNPAGGPGGKVSRAEVVKNRAVLVTGGAQGFGEELTRGLVAEGAFVFIADLNLAGAEKLAQSLNGEYGKPVAFPAAVNVADEASVTDMAEVIALNAGGLDLCVSNAGVLRAAGILEQDMTSFKFVTDINYTAFAIVTKHCALLMKAQNEAAPGWITDIIQINSKSGLEGSNKNGSYAGSKFGGIGLVQSFAKELVEYRIKVNAVCPGNFFEGPLWSDPEKGLFAQYLKAGKVPGAKTVQDIKNFYESKVPMNRGCRGGDVLRAVLYLVEQEYETGQALPVTGGQVMLS